ncbi:AfsR/SARP family transcriptional regulator, partial [Streptomyces sp. Ru87]|uniref:AfsR/SARP family transcriptional regulator n=1 Tax=Streptomyces sp. Ru87 TaxID=2044307 RepID=UPI000D1F6B54
MTVGFTLLGPVEAVADGRQLDLGHARQRSVLAVLLAEANRAVPTGELADRVWGNRSPQRHRNTLHSYLSRIRQALEAARDAGGDATLERQPGGYCLTVDPDSVDLHRFTALLARARASGTDEEAAALFEQALGLWRGEALAGLDTPWFGALRDTLHQQRSAAALDRNDALLRCGRHGPLLPVLTADARADPLDERLAGQLMLALHRCGRPADALAYYRELRSRLRAELGMDPSAPLRELHQQILTADPGLSLVPGPRTAAGTGAGAGPGTATGTPPPRQLPAPPPLFTGRDGELAALTAALAPGGDGAAADALAIGVIGGIGGVGKTWLAVRWAHDHLDRFPDGQLYVNLRGFDPSAPPVPPASAIRQLLDALDVRPASVPPDPEALAGYYRGLLADRRMLILLDNARDAEQVRPLLPGGTGCTVLVTSRNRLGSLVTTHGARTLPLGSLPAPEARALLTRHLGPQRIAAEPDAVSALLEHCAGLPLALGVVAARAAAHPGFPLAGLAGELRESADRLDALGDADLTADLRAVFSSSYHALGEEAARLYGLLGLVPGPDCGLHAAASLAATTPARARVHLRELEAAHLVEQHAPGRYRMHDLVRLHAAERGNPEGPDDARDEAVRRLVDFHLHTGLAANRLLDGVHTPFAPEPAPP